MLGNRRYWKVFVAHPSDVDKDASEVEQAIDEINELRSNSIPLQFRSEKHGVPGVGKESIEDPLKKILDESDIFVCIMWKKFGEPIKFRGEEYKSGTEAEFKYALEKIEDKENIDILFYFSNRRCKPNETDPKQYGLVKEFHDSLIDQIKKNR